MLSSALIGCFTVHQGAAINKQGIETAFECTIVFTFTFEIHLTYSVCTMDQQYLPHILQDQMLVSGAQDL